MRILILSNMYPSDEKPYSGVFVKNQYQEIKKQLPFEDDIQVLYMKRAVTGKFASVIKYISFIFKNISIFKNRYDVIHLHYFFPLGVIPFLYKIIYPDCKIILTAHGSDIHYYMNKKIIRIIFKKIVKRYDHVISVGKELAVEIEKKFNIKVNSIISAGVDNEVFYKDNKIRKKYDFLFVGSFIERKGVDLLCDIIEENKLSEYTFCFVGSGPLESSLKSLEREDYRITIMKNKSQNELRDIYNQAKWFLFPSRNEPFGLVITESIFCGTPVLGTKVGGIKEQIIEGKNGYFLKAKSKKDIVKKIRESSKIVESKYDRLVNETLKTNKQYSLEKVCEQLLNIYYQQ